jgi:hypothetical protein
MRNAYRSRWLLLLVGLGALSGCARVTDPDPIMLAQVRSLAEAWAAMPDASETALAGASTPAPAAVTRERPVTQTSAIQSEGQQPPSPSVGAAPATTTRRTLWDKQPWEVELDKIVRAICRGC